MTLPDFSVIPQVRAKVLEAEEALREAKGICKAANLHDTSAELTPILGRCACLTGKGMWLDSMEADDGA